MSAGDESHRPAATALAALSASAVYVVSAASSLALSAAVAAQQACHTLFV